MMNDENYRKIRVLEAELLSLKFKEKLFELEQEKNRIQNKLSGGQFVGGKVNCACGRCFNGSGNNGI